MAVFIKLFVVLLIVVTSPIVYYFARKASIENHRYYWGMTSYNWASFVTTMYMGAIGLIVFVLHYFGLYPD
jgi:hypothetical protein